MTEKMDELDALDDSLDWDEKALADREGGDEEILAIKVVNWRYLDDDEEREALTELSAWVSWLVERYNIQPQKIPGCWAQHGDLVEELSALHTAHLVAFDETDGGYGPIGWHERFAAALARPTFRERCSGGHRTILPRHLQIATALNS